MSTYKAFFSKLVRKAGELAGPMLLGYELNEQFGSESQQVVKYIEKTAQEQIKSEIEGNGSNSSVIKILLILVSVLLVLRVLMSAYKVIRRNRRVARNIELEEI